MWSVNKKLNGVNFYNSDRLNYKNYKLNNTAYQKI